MAFITKKKIIIGSGILLVLIGLVIGGIFWYNGQTANVANTDTSPPTSSNGSALTETQLELGDKIADVLETQGNEEASKVLDQQLGTTTDASDKSYIYTLKMGLETSKATPDYAAALSYALEAEKANPTFDTALNVADIAYMDSQFDVAKTYYQLYLDRSITSDGTQLDPAARPYYENRLKELNAS